MKREDPAFEELILQQDLYKTLEQHRLLTETMIYSNETL